jgi:hypothetical protein
MLMHYSFWRGGTGVDSTKTAPGHVTSNLSIPFDGIRGSRSAFQCVWGAKCPHTNFQARVGPGAVSKKAHRDTLRRTCVFALGGICGSRNAFQCVQHMKYRCTIFYARLGSVWIPQKMHRDPLCRTCVFSFGGTYESRSAF